MEMAEGMRVRVRGAAGGPTYKIHLPPPCRLHNLLHHLSALTSLPASSLTISLNKRDPITLHNPQATLTSLGITSGDLLFYLTTSPPPPPPPPPQSAAAQRVPALGFGDSASVTAEGDGRMEAEAEEASRGASQGLLQENGASDAVTVRRMLCASAALQRVSASQGFEENASNSDVAGAEGGVETTNASKTLATDAQEESHIDSMKSDEEDSTEDLATDAREIPHNRVYLIPDLLQRVLVKEENNARQQEGFLVLALHAVMLETGFICENASESAASWDPYALPPDWSRASGPINLYYTLPNMLASSSPPSEVGIVMLRCQIVGGWLVVYGTITGGTVSEIHRLMLSSSKYLSENLRNIVEVNARSNANRLEDLASSGSRNISLGFFSNIFEFWKEVKDNLSLRLLADLCERSGLSPPPSFLLLPTELKMGILEMLPAPALAKLGCVCTEFRFLTSNDDLWKEKYKKEFGLREGNQSSEVSWKFTFQREWVRRKQRAEGLRDHRRRFRPDHRLPFRLRRPPQLGPGFGIIGGDYDIFPALPGFRGGTAPGGPGGGFWTHSGLPRGYGGNNSGDHFDKENNVLGEDSGFT